MKLLEKKQNKMKKKHGRQIFFKKRKKDRQRNRTLRTTELMLKIWAPRK